MCVAIYLEATRVALYTPSTRAPKPSSRRQVKLLTPLSYSSTKSYPGSIEPLDRAKERNLKLACSLAAARVRLSTQRIVVSSPVETSGGM